jgi:uncharacterized protein (TIGR03000 family)
MLGQRPLIALAAAVLLAVSPLTIQPALGQGPGGYYYETYRYGYNPGYYARHYPSPPAAGALGRTGSGGAGYWYHVPGPAAAAPAGSPPRQALELRLVAPETSGPAEAAAQIELRVPADAEVWIDGARTTQTGAVRRFVSPPLPPGREYSYEVRVGWKDAGREVTQSRRLAVRAGSLVPAAFPAPAGEPRAEAGAPAAGGPAKAAQ